jgi:hypothetical protein
MRTSRYLLGLGLIVFAIGAGSPGFAATQSKKQKSATMKKADEVYRCRDANGQTRMGQALPPECLDLDIEVLNKSGQVVRILPGKERRAQLELEKAAKAEEKEKLRQAQERDRMLMAAYTSVAEIERDRDDRIKMLDARASVTLQNVDNLNKQQARLEKQISRYRPYNESPDAKPLPEDLAKQAVRMVDNRKAYDAELAEIEEEKTKIREKYQGDIERFKELKAISAATP